MMSRPIWSGTITFGLVSIPVKLFVATQRNDIAFRSLHADCGTPLKRPYYCPKCDVQVTQKEIVKGYEVTKGEFVVLTDEDLRRVPLESSKMLQVKGFVEREEVDPILYDSSYYLGPAGGSARPFELFRQALDLTNKVAVATAAIWKKEQVVTIRPRGRHLVLSTLHYADEIRDPPELLEEMAPTEQEVELAMNLIQALTMSFDIRSFRDRYREALEDLIKAKLEGREVKAPAAEVEATPEDLMEALKASLESIKKT